MFRPHRLFAVAVGLVFGLLAEAGLAQAQPPGPPAPNSRPAFSPYLNLARRDNSPAVNYYGLVRPQIATANTLQGLQQQVTTIGQTGNNNMVPGSDLPITGQPVYFLNTAGYFMNTGGGPGSSPAMSGRPTINRSAPAAPPRRR